MKDYTVEQIYHVVCSLTGIHVGVLTRNGGEWEIRSVVTDEAINAVMDYSRQWADEDGRKEYVRRLPDGQVEVLVYTIKDKYDD